MRNKFLNDVFIYYKKLFIEILLESNVLNFGNIVIKIKNRKNVCFRSSSIFFYYNLVEGSRK